jgi:hypothetical protein
VLKSTSPHDVREGEHRSHALAGLGASAPTANWRTDDAARDDRDLDALGNLIDGRDELIRVARLTVKNAAAVDLVLEAPQRPIDGRDDAVGLVHAQATHVENGLRALDERGNLPFSEIVCRSSAASVVAPRVTRAATVRTSEGSPMS